MLLWKKKLNQKTVVLLIKIKNKMNINGICYIANKYQTKEKDFKRFERFATGKIAWTDNVKDKSGTVSKSYTNKSFVCFDMNTIDILDGCQKDLLIIEGQLRTEYYTNKEGEKKSIEKVIISKAKIYDKATNSKEVREVKEEAVEEFNDDIPF